MGALLTGTLDFGGSLTQEATLDITGQTGLTATNYMEAFVQSETSVDHTVQDHEMLANFTKFVCSCPVAGTLRILALVNGALTSGRYTIRAAWN